MRLFALGMVLVSGVAMADVALGPVFVPRPVDVSTAGDNNLADFTPSIASLGNQSLVIWCGEAGLWGTRIAADGSLLDPAPVLIGPHAGCGSGVQNYAAGGDGSYLVLVGGSGAIVSADGGVTPPFSIPGSTLYGNNGAWFQKAWTVVGAYSGNVAATRVDAAGNTSTAVSLTVGGLEQATDVDCSSSSCLAVWGTFLNDHYEVHGVRLDAALNQVGSEAVLASEQYEIVGLSIARAQNKYLVVWKVAGQLFPIHAVRVDFDGFVRDLTPLEPGFSTPSRFYGGPQIASFGENFAVVWPIESPPRAYQRKALATRISEDGDILDSPPVVIGNNDFPVFKQAISADSEGYLVAGAELYGRQAVWVNRLTPSLNSKDGHGARVSIPGQQQAMPTLAANPSGYCSAWAERRENGLFSISGALLNLDGSPRDAGAFSLTDLPGQKIAPRAAWGDGYCLIVWQDQRNERFDIYGARVDSNGDLLDPSGFAIASGAANELAPVVSWAGSGFFVAWQDERNDEGDIYGAWVKSDGGVTPLQAPISNRRGRQAEPEVASHGGRSIAMWRSYGPDAGLYFAEFADGGVLESETLFVSSLGLKFSHQVFWIDDFPWVTWRDDAADTVFGSLVRSSSASWILQEAGVPSGAAWNGRNTVLVTDDPQWVHARLFDGVTPLESLGINDDGEEHARTARVACIVPRKCLVIWESVAAGPSITLMEIHARALLDNIAPSTSDATLHTNEDTPLAVVLNASDVDDDTLVYTLASPQHGTLTGTPPSVEYVPGPDFNGEDSFTFTVNDGFSDSNVATVGIQVAAVNDMPRAEPQNIEVRSGDGVAVLLSGSDVDGDTLSFELVMSTLHGSLVGNGGTYVYTPAPGFVGDDALSFVANDGQLRSAPAQITLKVLSRTGGGNADAGVPDPSDPNHSSPCGCSTGAPAILALLGLLFARRRRL